MNKYEIYIFFSFFHAERNIVLIVLQLLIQVLSSWGDVSGHPYRHTYQKIYFAHGDGGLGGGSRMRGHRSEDPHLR